MQLACITLAIFLVGLVSAQRQRATKNERATKYVDPDNGITFLASPIRLFFGMSLNSALRNRITHGYVFPPLSENSTEFIGEIVAPRSTGWAGASLTGGMTESLLLLTWLDGETIIGTNRFTTPCREYNSPRPYAGPKITNLASSKVNATHWKWVYRCENCTGNFPTAYNGVSSWVYSRYPMTHRMSMSTVDKHDDHDFFAMNFGNASCFRCGLLPLGRRKHWILAAELQEALESSGQAFMTICRFPLLAPLWFCS
ncbi:CBD9-like protein [Gymnopus androsaceus JB14]|uniref:CBD9-like protein n=1 Tax=Gymnopus androsaceus JB14 TaxID=1447944 RepID=A0A6A4HMW3_9AGAR|nr:CBD9-like protein [Gymnopus androsaceus JB14]